MISFPVILLWGLNVIAEGYCERISRVEIVGAVLAASALGSRLRCLAILATLTFIGFAKRKFYFMKRIRT